MKKVFVIDSAKGHIVPWMMAPKAYPELGGFAPVLKDGNPVLDADECQKLKRSCEALAVKGLPLMWLGTQIQPAEEEGDGACLRIVGERGKVIGEF